MEEEDEPIDEEDENMDDEDYMDEYPDDELDIPKDALRNDDKFLSKPKAGQKTFAH